MNDDEFNRLVSEAIKKKFPTVSDMLSGNNIALEAEETNVFESQQDKDLALNRELRKKYTPKLYWFMVAWTGFVGLTVIFQGFGWSFHLEPNVMIALLTTTTASVLGLMHAILKGLFPTSKP